MKNLFSYFCVFSFFYFGTVNTLYSQNITYRPGEPVNFTCTVPAPANLAPVHNSPYRQFLIEYGDGDYSTTLNTGHHTTKLQSPSSLTALGYSYAFYDTTHKPSIVAKNYTPITQTAIESPAQELLTPDSNIRIYSLIKTIRPFERAHMVCTYKEINCIVALYYNMENSSFFSPIVNASDQFEDDEKKPVKLIRCYNGQTAYTDQTLAQLTATLASTDASNLNRAWQSAKSLGFKNAIFIVSKTTGKQKNFFITLPPPQSIEGYYFNLDSTTYINAQLIPISAAYSTVTAPSNNIAFPLIFSSRAHDPNGFRIYRDCKLITPVRYKYTLDFANNGLGDATTVTASMYIPAAQITELQPSMINCTFAGIRVIFRNGFEQNVPYFKIAPGSNKVFFYFKGLRLPGTRRLGAFSDSLSAHISFTLLNKTGVNISKSAFCTVNFDESQLVRKSSVITKCPVHTP